MYIYIYIFIRESGNMDQASWILEVNKKLSKYLRLERDVY